MPSCMRVPEEKVKVSNLFLSFLRGGGEWRRGGEIKNNKLYQAHHSPRLCAFIIL